MVPRTSESDPWLTTSAVNEPVLGAAGSILIASRPPFGTVPAPSFRPNSPPLACPRTRTRQPKGVSQGFGS